MSWYCCFMYFRLWDTYICGTCMVHLLGCLFPFSPFPCCCLDGNKQTCFITYKTISTCSLAIFEPWFVFFSTFAGTNLCIQQYFNLLFMNYAEQVNKVDSGNPRKLMCNVLKFMTISFLMDIKKLDIGNVSCLPYIGERAGKISNDYYFNLVCILQSHEHGNSIICDSCKIHLYYRLLSVIVNYITNCYNILRDISMSSQVLYTPQTVWKLNEKDNIFCGK